MQAFLANEIQSEADLIERFVRSYRKRFAAVIDELNRQSASVESASPTGLHCLRLCVETMDMVLLNQDRMGILLRQLADESSQRKAA